MTCSWEIDDLEDLRCIPTHHSKVKESKNSHKNQGIKEALKITKMEGEQKEDSSLNK